MRTAYSSKINQNDSHMLLRSGIFHLLLMGAINKMTAAPSNEARENLYLLHEEAEGVEPRQKHLANGRLHPFLLELKRFRTHHGGIDEIHP